MDRIGSSISDLDDAPVLPVIGKLRLGIQQHAGNGHSHPVDLDHFRCSSPWPNITQRFQEVYGDTPTAVEIVLMSENIDEILANNLEWWAKTRKCRGNGHTATRMWKDVPPELQQTLPPPDSPFTKVDIPCPCILKRTACGLKGRFKCMLPEIHPAAAFLVSTGSIINIREIRGILRSYKEIFGRISRIRFTLSRRPVRLQYQDQVYVHYLLHLLYEGDLASVNAIRAADNLGPLPFTAAGPRLAALRNPMEAEPILKEEAAAKAVAQAPETHNTPGGEPVSISPSPTIPASSQAPQIERQRPATTPALQPSAQPAHGTTELVHRTPEPDPPIIPSPCTSEPLQDPENPSAVPPAMTSAPAHAAPSVPSAPPPPAGTLPSNAPHASPEAAASAHPSTALSRSPHATAATAKTTTVPTPQPPAAGARPPAGATSTPSARTLSPLVAPAQATEISKPAPQSAPTPPRCACGATVTDRVATYSQHKYGTILCMTCQKKRPPATART